MANVIVVKRRREVKINRGVGGNAVIKIDSEAADVLEKLLSESRGELSVRDLASSMIKYAANDTVITVED